jgi:hypothetical protein
MKLRETAKNASELLVFVVSVHRPVKKKKQSAQIFGNCISFHPQVRRRHLLCWVPYKELTVINTV